MNSQHKRNLFGLYGLFFAISITLALITAMFHKLFYRENALQVFLIYLTFSFLGITIVFFLANKLFRSNPFSRISERVLPILYKASWNKRVAVGAILGATFFGCSFAALQLIAHQFDVKAHYPYSIVDSVLRGIIGGLGFILLFSLKQHQVDNSVIFISGFIGFGISQYIVDQGLTILYIGWGWQELLIGALTGLSFGVLHKKRKWVFLSTSAGIVGYGIVYFLLGDLINWVALKLVDVLPQITPSNVESFYLRSGYLMMKTSYGIVIGVLFGSLVIIFDKTSVSPRD